MSDQTQKTPPVARIQRGAIGAAIWRRLNKDNVALYSVTIRRAYKDDSGNWQNSDSFSGDDLLVVAAVMQIAWEKIHRLRAEDRAAKQNQSGTGTTPRNPDVEEDVPF